MVIKAVPEACYAILHMGTGPSQFSGLTDPQIVVKDGERFELGEGVWIEKLGEPFAKNFQHACEPPHYQVSNVGYDRHLYAFVRQVPEVETRRYEGLDVLHTVVALSRLVHPTSTGDRYCAHVAFCGMADSSIYAVQYRGTSPDVFLSSRQRDWLSVEDAEVLRTLMPWTRRDKKMHGRIHRAYWYHEHAVRSYFLEVRLPLVVTGIESLINTDENNNKRQFCRRVRQLACRLQIDLSDSDLSKAWKLRSKLLHAEGFLHGLESTLPQNEHSDLQDRLESVLRMTVRDCLLDETFGNYFQNTAAVEMKWPI